MSNFSSLIMVDSEVEPMPTSANRKISVFEFDNLELSSGLRPLMDSYRKRGYNINAVNGYSDGSGINPESNTIIVDLISLSESPFPILQEFQATILHELGHAEAKNRDLNVYDEELAWQLAEEICPIKLPMEWNAIKQRHLKSYAPKQKGARLSDDDIELISSRRICPQCMHNKFRKKSNSNAFVIGWLREEAICCTNCRTEYHLVWTGNKVSDIYFLEPITEIQDLVFA